MLKEEQESKPFVSIGVTTYNRHDLLRQTLDSILAQTYSDFEVIVGNDYTAEVLTGAMLGITDPRIRFVNHPQNLGEVGNMNSLIGMARGRYFTWLFDDDLYEPDFLQTASVCLTETGFPPAFFSSFRFLRPKETFEPKRFRRKYIKEFTGREFLRWYSPRKMQIASILGLFDLDILRNILGGVEALCPSAIGVYSEYLFLVRCALLDRIIYTNEPLVIYRVHSGSWSESPFELGKYIQAGKELIRRCGEELRHSTLVEDYNENLMMICEQHLVTIAYRSAKIEVANKKFGFFPLWRAIKRYREEAMNTRENFITQGGNNGLQTGLNFIRININCYRIIAINFITHFFKNISSVK